MRGFCGQASCAMCFLLGDSKARHGTTTHGRISGRSSFAEAVKKRLLKVLWSTGCLKHDDANSMIKFVAAEVVRGVGGDNNLRRRGHATGAMWKNKLCSRLTVNNVAWDEIAWPSKSHTGRGVINQPEVLCESRCVLRGCVGVPVVGMPLFSPFLPRVRKIADEPQNKHVDWIWGIGLDGQGVPSVNIIRREKSTGCGVPHQLGCSSMGRGVGV